MTADLGAHTPTLRRLARFLTRSDSDADDLVQETFARALTALTAGQAPENVRAWLVTILKNLHLDACRTRQRRPQASLEETLEPVAPTPEAPPAWSQIEPAQVEAALRKLDPDLRAAYELRAARGLSYDEIAAELNIPRATVGTRIMRARRQLHALLLEEIPS